MRTQHANAWYFHCDFQQNIALICTISYFVLLLLFTDASRLIQLRSSFFSGRDIGNEVTVETVVEGYHIPKPTRGPGERRQLPQRGPGWSSSRKLCSDVLYAIFCAILDVLMHFESWLPKTITTRMVQMPATAAIEYVAACCRTRIRTTTRTKTKTRTITKTVRGPYARSP